MNILPKKRWHVRTRENIARVRRDEAEAAEKEKTRKARAQIADTEARINLLRETRRAKYDGRDKDSEDKIESSVNKSEHVNFFADLENGKIDHHKPNVEHEAEKKAEKEKYEQQIGYLTYLGQNINNKESSSSWYDQLPRRLSDKQSTEEIQGKKKMIADPMMDIKKYIDIMKSSSSNAPINSEKSSRKRKIEDNATLFETDNSNKHKKKKKKKEHKSKRSKRSLSDESHQTSSVNIDKLREKRLLREQEERMKTDSLLKRWQGEPTTVVKTEQSQISYQKYNSQFCPEIARQNVGTTWQR